jgi:hypothetical protein
MYILRGVNLGRGVPEVRTKRFHRGTSNSSKRSHASADLGNICCLPKLAKERELDPCKHWVVPVLDPIRRKLEDLEKHKRRIFSYNRRTNFCDFVGLNFALVKFLQATPLPLCTLTSPRMQQCCPGINSRTHSLRWGGSQ